MRVFGLAGTEMVPLEPYVAERITELMIARELERRVQAGEVIAHVGTDGETYFERAATEFIIP